jgi:hypothetical protein
MEYPAQLRASPSSEVRAKFKTPAYSYRVERRLPTDLPGRTPVAYRSATILERFSGKWEGDTLVVQTNGLRDDIWLDLKGDPLTEAARLTERFRRPTYGRLEIELTVDDPKAYTNPWTVTFKQTIMPDTELLDEICLENEKSYRHLPGK